MTQNIYYHSGREEREHTEKILKCSKLKTNRENYKFFISMFHVEELLRFPSLFSFVEYTYLSLSG